MQQYLQSIIVLVLLVLGTAPALAQEIGGPYTSDEHTVLLMHFNDNLDIDVTDYEIGDAIGRGNLEEISGDDFIEHPSLSELGQQVIIDNLSSTDSSYIVIPDTAALDLTGDWTIEFWLSAISFGETPDAHNYAPRVIIKENPDALGVNYFGLFNGGSRAFVTGFAAEEAGCCVTQDSPGGLFAPNEWFHVVFARDSSARLVTQLVRGLDSETGELTIRHHATDRYPEGFDTPIVNDGALFIGGFPALDEGTFLNGLVDELRISNTVRTELLPPGAIANVLPGDSPQLFTSPDSAFTVTAQVFDPATTTTLYYRTGTTGPFQAVAMTTGEDESTYVADIPAQPEGTSVQYYVEGTSGGATTTSPVGAAEPGFLDYYGIGFQDGTPPDQAVMLLDFEEGSDGEAITDPQDRSPYGHGLQVFGTPTYSSNAAVGNAAMQLNAVDAEFLAVGAVAPFLSAETVTVDVWFNMASIEPMDFIIDKSGDNGVSFNPWESNYRIGRHFDGNNLHALFFRTANGLGEFNTGLDPELNAWYRAILNVSADTAFVQFRDAAGTVVAEMGGGGTLPLARTRGPFFVGSSKEPFLGDDGVPNSYFDGLIDEVRVYNYAALRPVRASVEASQTGVVLAEDTAGVQITFSTASDTAGTLTATHYAAAPGSTGLTGEVTAPGGELVAPSMLSEDQHWIVDATGVRGATAEVCLAVGSDSELGDVNDLVVVKRATAAATWEAQTTSLQTIAEVDYLCVDGQTSFGEYAVAIEGTGSDSDEVAELPRTLQMDAPYPNPSSGRAVIPYALPRQTTVRLAIYDVLGREVAVLKQGMQPAGDHTVTLERDLPAGVYFARLKAGDRTLTRKLLRLE